MLRLSGGQVESLWDDVLPVGVRELPADLAALDLAVRDRRCSRRSRCFGSARRRRDARAGPWASDDRDRHLCAVDGDQAAHGLGVRNAGAGGLGLAASAALLSDRARRAGSRRVDGAEVDPPAGRRGGRRDHALVIAKAQRETRFRGGAVRIDSTVVEADVRYPTDSGLDIGRRPGAGPGARQADGEGRRDAGRVGDRSRALGRRLRLISRTLARRTGERKQEVLRLTEQAGRLFSRSSGKHDRLAVQAAPRPEAVVRGQAPRSSGWKR